MKEDADNKNKRFKETLIEAGWSGKKKDDRYVVFTERIPTIDYLRDKLVKDFDLPEKAIRYFHGGFSDVDQQAIIEDFGKQDSDVRILICSDAGSQGVNLHYYCNHMINYDIPWSLITLEQRNGRIDRYGQTKTPYIYYLIGETHIEGLKTDLHIIKKLTDKEEEVYKTLGDAGSVMHLYDEGQEEEKVTEAIIQGDEEFLEEEETNFDFSSLFEDDTTDAVITSDPYETPVTIYPDDGVYYQKLFRQLESSGMISHKDYSFPDETYLELTNTEELNEILYDMPAEAKPKKGELFKLTLDKDLVQQSIENARKKKGDWAEFQMLYDLHPAIKYYMTKLEASVEKGVAPAARLSTKLPEGSVWYVLHGQVSNNLGQPVISDFFVVGFNSRVTECLPVVDFVSKFGLNQTLYTENITEKELLALKENLPEVISYARNEHMKKKQSTLQNEMFEKIIAYEKHLNDWKSASLEQLEVEFRDRSGNFWKTRKEKKKKEIQTIADNSSQYMKDMTSLDQDAYIKVMAVFFNPEV